MLYVTAVNNMERFGKQKRTYDIKIKLFLCPFTFSPAPLVITKARAPAEMMTRANRRMKIEKSMTDLIFL